MADKQPENGDRFERFGSDMFRCSTPQCLATKMAVIHGCCNVQALALAWRLFWQAGFTPTQPFVFES